MINMSQVGYSLFLFDVLIIMIYQPRINKKASEDDDYDDKKSHSDWKNSG